MNAPSVIKIWIRLVLLSSLLCAPVHAWVKSSSNALWPDGTVNLVMALGESPTYANGLTPNGAGQAAALKWNGYMQRVKVTVSTGTTGSGSYRNGVNEVLFGSSYDGTTLQSSVLAITFTRTSGSRRVETDIVVNDSKNWGNYTGGLVSTNPDLGRVITHEVGHVLGLGHPDENAQNYIAIMNSHVSNIHDLVTDDIEGIANLYGVEPGSAPVRPVITWTTSNQSLEEKQGFELTVGGLGATSYACQWYKDGVAIEGANGVSFKVLSALIANSGVYYLEVRGISGSARSADIRVTVVARTAPTVRISNFTNASFYLTTGIQLYVETTGSQPMTFQWQKDGVAIPGATQYYYNFVANSLSDEGDYRVVATNDVGSTASAAVHISVKAVEAPVFSSTLAKLITLEEGSSTGFYPTAFSPATMQWEWFKDGVKLPNTSSQINFRGVESEAGLYTIKASNVAGSSLWDFKVVVVPVPALASFALSPSFSQLKEGANYTLRGTGDLRSEYSYQWYKDGVLQPGKTGSTLYLSGVKLSDAGDYFLVVKTAGGTTSSWSATLQVQAAASAVAGTPARTLSFGGVAYCLQTGASVLQRFDLVSGLALPSLPLPGAVSQFCAGEAGVFVALSGGEIWRCSPGASAFELFSAATNGVVLISTTGDTLFWLSKTYGQMKCVQVSSKAELSGSSNNGFNYNLEMPVSAKNKRLYLFNGSSDGASYYLLRYAFDGEGLKPQNGSSWDMVGPHVYLNRDETLFVDSVGNIFDSVTLKRSGNLGFRVESFAELSDGRALVLGGGLIHLLNPSLVAQQSMPAPAGTVALFAQGERCQVLQQDQLGGLRMSSLDLGQFAELLQTSASFDAAGVALPPDALLLDKQGLLWTMSRSLRSLVAWSPESKRVVKSLLLRGCANLAAYSAENHSIYLAYADGLVSVVDLSAATVTEKVFNWVSGEIVTLNTAGPLVLVQQGRYSTVSYFYDVQGKALAVNTSLGRGAQFAWDASRGKAYGASDGQSPNTLTRYAFSSSAQITEFLPSPVGSNLPFKYPLRVGETSLLMGSGVLLDLETFKLITTLPERHLDAAWLAGAWYTVVDSIDGSVVKRYDRACTTVEKTGLGVGRAKQLFALSGNRLLLVSEFYGVHRYTIFDADLNRISMDGLGRPNRLANISVQADAEQGINALVPGFVINGTSPKTLLLRGCGPGLAGFGVPGCLEDPTITLYDKDGKVLANNDDWSSLSNAREVRLRSADLYAFELAKGSKDAVILVRLNPGLYSAQVQGNANGIGRAMVEVYDAEEAPGDSRAVNMAARCKISKNHEAVGGFVVQGTRPKMMLIRAIGPGLLKYSVPGASADPKLRVFSGSTVIAENNDWSSDASKAGALRAAFTATGAFPLDAGSKDAALLIELQPGNYTLYMESADGGSGVGMMELYEVPTADSN